MQYVLEAQKELIYEYLLLISPALAIKNEITKLKKAFHSAYDHLQAVYSKPHITLANFGFNIHDENAIIDRIIAALKLHSAFSVKLSGFNHFGTHTIYTNIEIEAPIVNLVHSLHTNLGLPSRFFSWKPHLTVAKGLNKNKFNRAMSEFQTMNFEASFLTDKIVLMKRPVRQFAKYVIVKEFPLADPRIYNPK